MDWDDAYANGAHIPQADSYPPRWERAAEAHRDLIGTRHTRLPYRAGDRTWFDLFLPVEEPRGLAVFVHGGYWMRFDAGTWSHLATGALDRGWAVAMPSYTLCPEARIAQITAEIGAAIAVASAHVAGPIRLAGHSAGGHLVSRMICQSSPLPGPVLDRITQTLSISGVHDLRPLMNTAMNTTLRIDDAEASAESPVLLRPVNGARLTCWVGADERPEFVRQNALLANIWTGLGARTRAVTEAGRHHFDVIEGLAHAQSPITRAWLEDEGA